MLPGWSSDPSAPAPCFTWPRAELRATDVPQRRYVIVKLCEKKEELEKFQTKTVSNCANPEFDEDLWPARWFFSGRHAMASRDRRATVVWRVTRTPLTCDLRAVVARVCFMPQLQIGGGWSKT